MGTKSCPPYRAATIPAKPPEFDHARIVERPDGFYWQDEANDDEYGPFATLLEAVADMQSGAASGDEPGKTLAPAESEIGIAEWIDPETGEAAGNGTPRLEEH